MCGVKRKKKKKQKLGTMEARDCDITIELLQINYTLMRCKTGDRFDQSFFLRRLEKPKRSLKIVLRSLKICFYDSVNKVKYALEQ